MFWCSNPKAVYSARMRRHISSPKATHVLPASHGNMGKFGGD